jgi:6-phosphogluconolactonase (cycloisomerase 2 family)
MKNGSPLAFIAVLMGSAMVMPDSEVGAQDRDGKGMNLQIRGVFTMTNDSTGNAVTAYFRDRQGQLTPAGTFLTGGLGSGGGLGNQGALALSRSGRTLVVVNPGSDSISAFHVNLRELVLTGVASSGGKKPISVTLDGDRVYVLNAGSDSITGFSLEGRGTLSMIPGSVKPLSTSGAGSAEIGINPDGNVLVVTEKATQRLVTYRLDEHGVPGDPQVRTSNGKTPFGFSFDDPGHLIVSEAFGGAPTASALSSYEVDEDGSLDLLSGSIGSGETAACWVVVNGRAAFVSNTGSGTISSYSVGSVGTLALIDPAAARAKAPIDMALSRKGEFLYILSPGSKSIDIFQVLGSSLVSVGSVDVTSTANGLVAR